MVAKIIYKQLIAQASVFVWALLCSSCSSAPDAPKRPRSADATPSDTQAEISDVDDESVDEGIATADEVIEPTFSSNGDKSVQLPPALLAKLTPSQIAALQGLTNDQLAAMSEAELKSFLAQHAGTATGATQPAQSPGTLTVVAQLIDTLIKLNAGNGGINGNDDDLTEDSLDGLSDDFGEE